MNRIILVRHGEPDVTIHSRIGGDEIKTFLEYYDNASLKTDSYPSDKLFFLAQNAKTVFCSPLPRSVESAQRCGVRQFFKNSLFVEAIPPHPRITRLRLKPKTWLLMSRLLALAGFSMHGESLRMTRKRARKAASVLIGFAKNGDVILFGHGLFNLHIAAVLREKGYEGPKVPVRNFWDYAIYTRVD